jgi:hypothetical protein
VATRIRWEKRQNTVLYTGVYEIAGTAHIKGQNGTPHALLFLTQEVTYLKYGGNYMH